MTTDTTTEPMMIGPLSAQEWASFALDDEDERNPLPPCCANVSDLRSAIFDTFRMGGDPELFWERIASMWHVAEDHPPVAEHPTMVKLHAAYVAGRTVPDYSDGLAAIMARRADDVLPYLDEIAGSWDLNTREGTVSALSRLGGAFVAYVLDDDQRYLVAERLAGIVGRSDLEVCLVIDAFRAHHQLPYRPTHPDLRD